jgi:hypothetical protein
MTSYLRAMIRFQIVEQRKYIQLAPGSSFLNDTPTQPGAVELAAQPSS